MMVTDLRSFNKSSIDELYVARVASRRLGLSFQVAGSNTALTEAQLTSQEKEQYEQLEGTARQASWLLGRSALKRVSEMSGNGFDTSNISFPNRSYSLSHSKMTSIAIYTPERQQLGIGIDIEFTREINPGTAKYFLTEEEQGWLDSFTSANRQYHLRRLWTIKEAIFKSDPDNKGRILADYALNDCSASSGYAVGQVDPYEELTFFYCTIESSSSSISVAVSRRGS